MTELVARTYCFLRHGETDWNAQGLSQGRTDIPLNAKGLAQAAAAADKLRGHDIRTIVTSTLGRAVQTAEIVGEALGIAPLADPDLREARFGVQEGQKMGPWYDSWVEGAFTPEGAESFAELQARVVTAVNRALLMPGLVLIVAHGAMFRALRAAMGHSAHVRTLNGAPLLCHPANPWDLEELS